MGKERSSGHNLECNNKRTITEGDHRFFNNIFIGGDNNKLKYGMIVFDASQRPIYAESNLFLNGSLPMMNKTQDWVEDADRLGITQLTGFPFEHRDGTPFRLEKDYLGKERSASPVVGPIENLSSVKRIKVW